MGFDRTIVDEPRRRFVASAATVSLATLAPRLSSALAEPPPEVRKIRLVHVPTICLAPQYIARALLQAEGFEEIEYVSYPSVTGGDGPIAKGSADFTMDSIGPTIIGIDRHAPVSILAGVHLGCYELFANPGVRSLRDLKGKIIPIDGNNGPQHVFLSSMFAYVGLDPRRDIQWETHAASESMRLYREGKVDAYLAFPPEPQQLRSDGIRRVLVNTATDKPWSQYFCCLLTANAEFVRRFPVATKRVVRAILKAVDLCANDPESAARAAVKGGFTERYDFALDALREVNYRHWRTYDPENALRFFAVRLHDAGMVKSPPQEIISRGADWRFLAQIRAELKA